MSNNFCIKPFETLWINPEGTVCVCCKNPVKISDPSGKNYNVSSDKLSTIWMSDHMKTLRKKFINGEKPDECKQCWDEEDTGIQSLRKGTTQTFFESNPDIDRDLLIKSQEDSPVIRELNLTLTNKCNLACRICSPHASSLWVKEVVETKELMIKNNSPLFNNFIYAMHDDNLSQLSATKFQDDRLVELHSMSKDLRKIFIYGGEPLINEEILAYLQQLVTDNLSQNISLIMNTNCTVYKDNIIDLFSKFKHVVIYLSIDGIDKSYEYQRWPARYSTIEKNIKRYAELKDPFKVVIYVTMSILNIIDLEKILDKFDTYNLGIDLYNQVHTPNMLNVRNMPPKLKKEVVRILKNIDFTKYKNFNYPKYDHGNFIPNFVNLPPEYNFTYTNTEAYRNDLLTFLSISDVYRKTLIADYLPDLYQLLHSGDI